MTPEELKVAKAIKSLRVKLGESQQQFSERLKVVVRTVARWELEKPPRGDILLKLFEMSQELGREDLMRTFASALNNLPPKVLLESIRERIWPVMMQNIRAWGQMDRALAELEHTAHDARSKPDAYRSQIVALRGKVNETRKQTAHLAALIGINVNDFIGKHDDSMGAKAAKGSK